MKTTWVVLRWVGVLPSAIAGMVVAHAFYFCAATWSVRYFTYEAPPLLMSWIFGCTASACGGAAFIWAGSKTAPRFQRETGVVLAALLLFLTGFLTATTIQLHQWNIMVQSLIALAASLMTCCSTFYDTPPQQDAADRVRSARDNQADFRLPKELVDQLFAAAEAQEAAEDRVRSPTQVPESHPASERDRLGA